jgi:hypothetical protein
MGSVAKRRISAVFAPAKKHLFGAFCGVFYGLNTAALMRPIAKRLALRLSARTPEVVFALDHLDRVWGFLSDNWRI